MKSITIKQIYDEFTQEIDATGSSYRKVRATLKRMRDEAGVELQVKLNQSMSVLECELDRIHRELEDNDKPVVDKITTVDHYKHNWYRLILNDSDEYIMAHGQKQLNEFLSINEAVMAKPTLAVGEHTDTNHYIPYTTGQYNEQQPISTTTSQPTHLTGDGPTTSDRQRGTSDMVHPVSDEWGRDSQRTESTTDRAAFNRILRSMEDPGVATRRELAELERRINEHYIRATENN